VKIVDCCREQDVLDALASGRWPDRTDADLRAHVANCGICADVVDVAGALLADRADERGDAQIPSSAVMWWRAQMRARQEAARQAARPITVAQVVASVATIAVTVAALGALSPWFAGTLRGWSFGVGDAAEAVQAPTLLLAHGWMLPALILGVWLVLAPVAIYFAVADD
jgi:hypothetical protein